MNEAFITHMRKIDELSKAELLSYGVSGKGVQRGVGNAYTTKEEEFLISTEGQYTCTELSIKLNRTVSSIGSKATALGLHLKKGTPPPMTESELLFIKENAHLYTYAELARVMARNKSNIRRRAVAMGVQCILEVCNSRVGVY